MKLCCEKAGVPFQTFFNRSDMLGGSTLGNISTSHVSLSSVDVGMPQLAMHSAVETAGTADTTYARKAFEVFYAE
jgi:aspartyl aminopeptidase